MGDNKILIIIDKAVFWWVKQLGNATFDAGSGSNEMVALEKFLSEANTSLKVDLEKAELFKSRLKLNLQVRFNIDPNKTYYLKTDYQPEGRLMEVLRGANLLEEFSEILPWKTEMKISKNKVLVSSGYDAEFIEL